MHICCPYQSHWHTLSNDSYHSGAYCSRATSYPFQAQDRRVVSQSLSITLLLRSPTVSRPALLLYQHTPQGLNTLHFCSQQDLRQGRKEIEKVPLCRCVRTERFLGTKNISVHFLLPIYQSILGYKSACTSFYVDRSRDDEGDPRAIKTIISVVGRTVISASEDMGSILAPLLPSCVLEQISLASRPPVFQY